jgi:hypothetical protein
VLFADGTADDNPVKRVKLFKESNRRLRFVSDDEKKALLKPPAVEHQAMVVGALHTGIISSTPLKHQCHNRKEFRNEHGDLDANCRIFQRPN